ncbi:hypothetical protein D3C77_321820 [compost metagenome]
MPVGIDAVDRVAATVGIGVDSATTERAFAVGAEENHQQRVIGPVAGGNVPAAEWFAAFAGVAIGAVGLSFGLGAMRRVMAATHLAVGFDTHAALGVAAEQGGALAHAVGDPVQGEQGTAVANALEHLVTGLFMGRLATAEEAAAEVAVEHTVAEVAAGVVSVTADLAQVVDADQAVLGVPGHAAAKTVCDDPTAGVVGQLDALWPGRMGVADGADLGRILGVAVSVLRGVFAVVGKGTDHLVVAIEEVEGEDLFDDAVAERVFGRHAWLGGVGCESSAQVIGEGFLALAGSVLPMTRFELIEVGVGEGLYAGPGGTADGRGEGAGVLAAKAVVGQGQGQAVAAVGGGEHLGAGEVVVGKRGGDVARYHFYQSTQRVVVALVVSAVGIDEAEQ